MAECYPASVLKEEETDTHNPTQTIFLEDYKNG